MNGEQRTHLRQDLLTVGNNDKKQRAITHIEASMEPIIVGQASGGFLPLAKVAPAARAGALVLSQPPAKRLARIVVGDRCLQYHAAAVSAVVTGPDLG